MALKAVETSLDKVPEPARNYYRKDGEKFILDVEKADGFELANTSGLTSALEKERDNARKASDVLKKYGDISPEAARDAMTKVVEFSKLDVDGKIQAATKAREEQLIKQHDTEKGQLSEKIKKYASGLHNQLVVGSAITAIVEEGGNPHLLLPVITQHMRVREEGETFFTEVIDSNGTPRIGGTKDGVSVPMSPKQLVAEFKKDPRFSGAFSAGKASGGGADGSSHGGKSTPDISKMSPVEKMRWARANGKTS